jgi:hypothetical protein
LGLPEFPDLKGNPPRRTSTVKGLFASLVFIGLLVFGLASVFSMEDFLAWYGFGMAAWCLMIANVPVLRYREAS